MPYPAACSCSRGGTGISVGQKPLSQISAAVFVLVASSRCRGEGWSSCGSHGALSPAEPRQHCQACVDPNHPQGRRSPQQSLSSSSKVLKARCCSHLGSPASALLPPGRALSWAGCWSGAKGRAIRGTPGQPLSQALSATLQVRADTEVSSSVALCREQHR